MFLGSSRPLLYFIKQTNDKSTDMQFKEKVSDPVFSLRKTSESFRATAGLIFEANHKTSAESDRPKASQHQSHCHNCIEQKFTGVLYSFEYKKIRKVLTFFFRTNVFLPIVTEIKTYEATKLLAFIESLNP